MMLNPIRLDPVKRKGGIKARRLIAATSDNTEHTYLASDEFFMRLPRIFAQCSCGAFFWQNAIMYDS